MRGQGGATGGRGLEGVAGGAGRDGRGGGLRGGGGGRERGQVFVEFLFFGDSAVVGRGKEVIHRVGDHCSHKISLSVSTGCPRVPTFKLKVSFFP